MKHGDKVLIVILLMILAFQYFYTEATEIKGCRIDTIEAGEGIRYSDTTATSYYINTTSCGNCVDFNVTAVR